MSNKKSILSAGRPSSATLNPASIVEKINFEVLHAHKDAANNLRKYYDTLAEFAQGKRGSDTNILSSCKELIKMANEYVEVMGMEDEDEVEEPVREKKVANGSNVIEMSYAEKLAKFKASQASKEGK